MARRLKSVLISSVVMFCAAGSNASMAGELKFGVAAEPYPPFTVKDASGKWNGFEVDLINSICAQIKEKCTIAEVAWDGIIPALTSKKIDVIFNSMSITTERQKQIAFSVPYYVSPSMFVGPKGGPADISPKGLAGKVIGVQSSTTNAEYLKKYYKGSSIKYYNTQDDANADLAAGRIDFMLADALALTDFLKSKDGAGLSGRGMAPKDPIFGDGIGAGIRKEDTALKQKIDSAIKNLLASGAYAKIQKKYFDVNIAPH